MLVRLYARGLCRIDRFKLPLTQGDLAEVCGMTAVHANRLLCELRDEGICTFTEGEVRVPDLAQMFRAAHFTTHHLYLPPEVEQDLAARRAEAVSSSPLKVRVSVPQKGVQTNYS